MQQLIKLHPLDNVQILVTPLETGDHLSIHQQTICVTQPVGIGHKIADRVIEAGEKIIKYGVPIGSATTTINTGAHVHLHNMKSDYIPTYTIPGKNTDQVH